MTDTTLAENIRFLKQYLDAMTPDNWRDNREHCDRLVREMEEELRR